MKDDLVAEVHLHKNNSAVKCDWSTLSSSWLETGRKRNDAVQFCEPCL